MGVAVSLIAPDDCEKYKVVKKACEVEPGSIEQFKFEVLDRIQHIMNAASQVVDSETQIR